MKKITFFKVKRWYLLFLFASISYFSNGQCVNTIPYLTVTSDNSGNVQNISTCTYSTEYNTIEGLVLGENYIFSATEGDVEKYVSITNEDNVSIAHGPSPLVVNGITSTTVRLHVTNSASCDGGSICHVTSIQLLADCPAPVSLGVVGLTTTEATLFWTPIGTETAWDLQYGLTGFALGTGASQNNLAAANFNAINLLPGTTYQFYVRAKCATEDSLWAGPFSFTTVCLPVTDFAENFDSYQGGFNSQLPNCWEKGGNGTIYLESFGVSTPFSAPNAIYMYSSDFDGQPFISYALMPLTSNLQANTHRLRFKAYSTTGIDR
ncbi:MAG: fibronectin type III domain-containing protein, partial [Flavobacterium sp.]|nr:fibronectin type III domain-containing protein [Flavobacterium sp.]